MDSKLEAYSLSDEYLKRFAEVKGSVICKNLLGFDLSKPEEMAIISDKNLLRTVCPEMVSCAAKILDDMFRKEYIFKD